MQEPSQSWRQGFSTFAFWAGSTLLVSGLIHLMVVFALPVIGRGVLIDEVMPAGELEPQLYSVNEGSPTNSAQPVFRYADARHDSVYCAFDLRDGAVRIGGELDVPFWSISVHTLSGLVVGSVNHRAASGGRLDMFVMRPQLARDLAEAGAELPGDTLIVEMQDSLGVVRISGLATYEALRPTLREALSQTDCELATFSFAPASGEDDSDDDTVTDPDATPEDRPRQVPSPTPRPDTDSSTGQQ